MHPSAARRVAPASARALAVACVAALALALASCRQASAPASGSAAAEWFPLVEGATWVYELRTGFGRVEVEVTARGEMALPGERGRVFVMEERNLGPNLGFVETAPVGYLVREGYLARVTGIDFDEKGQLRVLGQEEPAWFLPLDPRPGLRWDQNTRLFEMPEGGGARLGWSGQVRERTRIRVPAGSFEDVTEIETVYRENAEGGESVDVVYHDFYVRGVGLVKSVSEDPSGDSSHRLEQVLRSYRFPR
jgi:hypothetical protein